MKKILHYFLFFMTFFIFNSFTVNVTCAQNIHCEIEQRELAGEIRLFKRNIRGTEECIWTYSFINRLLSNNDIAFLQQVHGLNICENDVVYDRLLEISNSLSDLNYNPLARLQPPNIISLHSEVLNILAGKLSTV